MNESRSFNEVQRFRQIWMIAFFSLLNTALWIGLWFQLVLKIPIGEKPMSDSSMIGIALFMLLLTLLFFNSKLETYINSELIKVRLFPFMLKNKSILWTDVDSCSIRRYKPLSEFGGWGIRGWGNNKALNVSGNIGLQLVFKDGRKLLIGTHKLEELQTILKELGKLQN